MRDLRSSVPLLATALTAGALALPAAANAAVVSTVNTTVTPHTLTVADDGTVRALAYDQRATNIVCSWHGYEFDLATGCHPGDASVRLTPVNVAVRDGQIYVSLPK